MTGHVRTATRPVSPALERRKTSAQNVQKVRQSLIPQKAVSYFQGYTKFYPALSQRWCLLLAVCPPGRFLTMQQTCVSKCPVGFFASRLSGVCEACSLGCLQCVDAQSCSRCQSNRKAQLFLQDGQCVQECVRSGFSAITAGLTPLIVRTCFFSALWIFSVWWDLTLQAKSCYNHISWTSDQIFEAHALKCQK